MESVPGGRCTTAPDVCALLGPERPRPCRPGDRQRAPSGSTGSPPEDAAPSRVAPTTTVRRRRESAESGQGPPEDPGTGLGAAVPRAVHEVRHRLHLPEGAEEGPAQADPAVLLPH